MNSRVLCSSVVVFLVVLSAALSWWLRGAQPQLGVPRGAQPPAPAVRPAASGERGAAVPAPRAERRAVEAAQDPAPPDDRLVDVRGRCVDEAGRPLAGVTVALHNRLRIGFAPSSARSGEGEDAAEPNRVVTGGDGRFAFQTEPPLPLCGFECDAQCAGRVPMRVHWGGRSLEHADRDLGDVVLPPGEEVSGRVVDVRGRAVADICVEASPLTGQRARDPVRPQDDIRAVTGAQGGFRFAALPVGRVRFDVLGRKVEVPRRPVTVARSSREVRIVVALPVGGPRRIRGRVVDPAGDPIADARIHVGVMPRLLARGKTRSAQDGSFMLHKAMMGSAGTSVDLTVAARGYEPWHSAQPVAWGADGLRVVLEPGPALTVRVRRAGDRRPVDRFGVVLLPRRERDDFAPIECEVRHTGRHPGGVLRLERVMPRRHWLIVHPAAGSAVAASLPVDVDLSAGEPLAVDVELRALVARRVEVVAPGGVSGVGAPGVGAPVIGARVELLRGHFGREVTLGMEATDQRDQIWSEPEAQVAAIDQQQTDDTGHAQVRGAAGRDYALRVTAPGRPATLAQPVRTDVDAPLRVVLGRGAVLSGTVGPPALVRRMRAPAGDAATGGTCARLFVALHRQETEPRSFPTSTAPGSGAPVTENGRFELRGVPPGTWTVRVVWRHEPAGTFRGWGRRGSGRDDVVTGLRLVEGEQRRIHLDLAPLGFDRVAIRGRINGHGRLVRLKLRRVADAGDDSAAGARLEVTTDDDGHAVVRLPRGDWTSTGSAMFHGRSVRFDGPEFRVPDASADGIDVVAEIAQRKVRIDQPAGGRIGAPSLLPSPGSTKPQRWYARSPGAQGVTTVFGKAGRVSLWAYRQPLTQLAVRRAWLRAHPEIDPEAIYVKIGEIELVPEGGERAVLRLPPEWMRLPGR